jgi:cytoskeletal protein CcmA (bactofilin family)
MARTVISPDTRVAGALTGKDDLIVDGTVEGPVTGEASVTIGATAKVNGEVRGRDVIVGGKLSHNVFASASIRLLASAEVLADLHAPRVAIDEGAVFDGKIKMRKQAAEAPAATPAPVPQVAPVAPAPRTREIPSLPEMGKTKLSRRTP